MRTLDEIYMDQFHSEHGDIDITQSVKNNETSLFLTSELERTNKTDTEPNRWYNMKED